MGYPGMFITFESIDGVGKSTHARLLAESLVKYGLDVYETKEPGDKDYGSIVGPQVRELLFKFPTTKKMAPGVADMLLLADHIQNVFNIRKALHNGEVVISDRYADSQFAYASAKLRQSPKWTLDLYREQYGITPDITFLLIARGEMKNGKEDISWALRRANERQGSEAGKQNGKNWNDIESQRTIQDAYIGLLKGENRTKIIEVHESDTIIDVQLLILKSALATLKGESSPQPYLTGLL